jgi:hypothetical protein
MAADLDIDHDFAQGAFGYFVLTRLEMLLAPLVEQAWTLETEH